MKALFLSLLLASPGFAQNTGNTPLTFYQAQFGGIDNYHDSAKIANEDFQEAHNVFTYKGYLEKRPGSVRVSEGVKPGYPITFQKEFINSSNEDLFIVQAGTQIFASDFGQDFVEIATVNVRGVTESVSAFGKHFFTNGYDTPWYTTGYDYNPVYTFPNCTHIEFAQERIWCTYESTLYASAFGDYTDWTIPIDLTADSANSWSFDAQDGKGLSCLYSSPYGILAWKRNKMFVLKGFDNDDFYKFRLSDNIGCTDPRSIQLVEGKVTWLGADGVYQWAGGNEAPQLISKDIDNTIKQVRQNTYYLDRRALNTPEDFSVGTASVNGAAVSWSHTITPGSIVPSTWGYLFNSSTAWASGGNFTNSFATTTVSGSIALSSLTVVEPNLSLQELTTAHWTRSVGDLSISASYSCTHVPLGRGCAYAVVMATCTRSGDLPAYTWEVYSSTGVFWSLAGSLSDPANMPFYIDGRNATGLYAKLTVSGGACAGQTVQSDVITSTHKEVYFWPFIFTNASSIAWFMSFVPSQVSSATYTTNNFDTGFSTSIAGEFALTESLPTGTTITYKFSEGHSSTTMGAYSTVVLSTTAIRIPLSKRYWQMQSIMETTTTTKTPSISSLTLQTASTGTWDSEVLFIGPAITAWNQFIALTNVTRADNVAFYTRASTSSFTQGDTTLPWVLQTNGLDVACATGAYVQVRTVSSLVSSTETLVINQITLNWVEGEVLQAASVYFDKNYYLGVTLSTGASTNDTLLVYQRNGKWVTHGGLTYGTLGLYDLKPHVGSGFTDSKIWRIIEEGAYYDDNTLPINAYVVTKDFQFDGQNNNKLLRQFYLESFPTTAGTLDLAYSVDKSTTYYTTSQALQANVMYNDEVKKMFPGYAKGRYAKFKFSNNVVDEYFKIDAYTVLGEFERLYRR